MILKDLTLAFRNLRRNKLLALINVIGLSVGISACLIIFLIASFELSFDQFQPERERIFRVYTRFSGGFSGINRGVCTGIPVAIRNHFTGLESVTNFHTFSAGVKVPGEKGTLNNFDRHNKIIIADPEYFEVFNYYKWLAGGPQQSLREPFGVVITESRARIYFGDVPAESVIGKQIHYEDSLILTVSGVLEDIRKRTDFDFTDFISSSTIEKSWLKQNISPDNWNGTNSSSQLFIKLAPGTTQEKIESQIPRLTDIYQSYNKDAEWVMTPKLQPLAEIHFDPEIGIFDSSRSVVQKSTIEILVLIAGLLLVIASINFINLETAQGSRRAKEVGVRKVLGSTRRKLITRFLAESFILCTSAIILSVILAALAMRYFAPYMPEGLLFDISDPVLAIFLLSCLVGVTLLAGLYPAFILSSYQPAVALKNLATGRGSQSRAAFIRKGLTIFQFSFAQVLIIGTIAVGLQIRYMLDKDLGFTASSVLYLPTPWHEKAEKRRALRNELEQIPEIELLSMHGAPPLSGGWSSTVMEFDNGKEVVNHNVYVKHGDTSYIKLYDIPLLAGRNLLAVDTIHEYLINENYMRLLGFTQPHDVLGKTVNEKYTVVGVVKDFHTQSLHSEITPTVIEYQSDGAAFGLKILTPENKVADMEPAIRKIGAAWKKIYPDEKFEYFFLDETVKNFYETEQRIGSLTRVATAIAILISCLGLFGLSSFTVVQRTKEIGIRKALGATVNNIMLLLSSEFLKLVLVAFILSAPIAYYFMDKWLNRFAYRMDISAWIFIAAGLVSVIIAFATISFWTINAAKSDPVKSLRYE